MGRWVVVRDMSRRVIECKPTENADEAYKVRCEELQAEGWELEESKHDWRFAHRGGDRIFIGVERVDPRDPPVPPSVGAHRKTP